MHFCPLHSLLPVYFILIVKLFKCPLFHLLPEQDIDNPANWRMYIFMPNFDSKNKYTFRTTPLGARVLCMNMNGKQQVNGWESFYKDWEGDDIARQTYSQTGAEFGDLKPKSQ